MAEDNDSEDVEYIVTADCGVFVLVVYQLVLETFSFAYFKTVRNLVYVPVVEKESKRTRPTIAAGLKIAARVGLTTPSTTATCSAARTSTFAQDGGDHVLRRRGGERTCARRNQEGAGHGEAAGVPDGELDRDGSRTRSYDGRSRARTT